MDIEDFVSGLWHTVGAAIVVAIVVLGVSFVFAPKKVDGYYLSQSTQRTGMATCVYAHWTWHTDEQSFCTNSYQEAVDFMNKANASVRQ